MLKRLSSSIARRHRHDLSTSPLLLYLSFLRCRSTVLSHSRCYHLSVVLYYCRHPYIERPLTLIHFIALFFHLLCSFMYTHNLAFISLYLSTLSTHRTARCSPHLVLWLHHHDLPVCLSSIVLSPDTYSHLHHLHAYTYIASYSLSSFKSYLIMASHISHVFALEIEALIEIGLKMRLHARRKKRLVFGAWGDHVACACGKMRSRCSKRPQLRNSQTYGRAFRRSRTH